MNKRRSAQVRYEQALDKAAGRWGEVGIIMGNDRTQRPKPCVECGGRYLPRKLKDGSYCKQTHADPKTNRNLKE